MYGYQQYLDPNRSLLNSGMQYQYGSGFPDHLKQWQQNDYDTSGIDYFSRQTATPRTRRRPGYRGPGIGWNGWGNGGRPGQQRPGFQAAPYSPPPPAGGKWWGGSYQSALNYSAPSRYGFF